MGYRTPLFIYLFIYLFILLRLGVTYIKTLKTITKPGRDTTTVRTNYTKYTLCALLQYLSNEMERLQKFTLWIIQPILSYAEALVALDITSLYERRQALSKALFDQIVGDQGHKLQELLPPCNGSTYCTRSHDFIC